VAADADRDARLQREGKPRRSEQSERSHAEARPPRYVDGIWDELLDWRTFHCSWCGEETHVGRDVRQSVEDFVAMNEWVYGDPPVCHGCQADARA